MDELVGSISLALFCSTNFLAWNRPAHELSQCIAPSACDRLVAKPQ